MCLHTNVHILHQFVNTVNLILSHKVLHLLYSFFFPFSHSAGDVLMMKPQNIASAVDEFIDLMQLNPDQKFTLEQNDEGTIKQNTMYFTTLLSVQIQYPHPQVFQYCSMES